MTRTKDIRMPSIAAGRGLVVGINGSARANGVSGNIVSEALSGASSRGAKTIRIDLSALTYSACLDCGGCAGGGGCVVNDGLTAVYKAIKKADAVIVASPVYFGSISAQLKMMIDRFQCDWVRRFRIKTERRGGRARKGFFFCVAGEKRYKFFRNSDEVIRNFFATIGVTHTGAYFVAGSQGMGKKPDQKTLRDAFSSGRALARSIEKERCM